MVKVFLSKIFTTSNTKSCFIITNLIKIIGNLATRPTSVIFTKFAGDSIMHTFEKNKRLKEKQ